MIKKLIILAATLSLGWIVAGCGESAADKALETAAPPPGPNAVANPPAVHKNIPTPPTAPGGPTTGGGGK